MLPLLLILVLVAACSSEPAAKTSPTPAPTPSPWPDGYLLQVCYGWDQIVDAHGHLTEALDAGAAFDFERTASEAEQAGIDAREAGEAFDAAGVWGPGRSMLVYLESAADFERKAANLVKLTVELLDPSAFDTINAYIEKVGYQLERATASLTVLKAKYPEFRC
jgi:hypothetical protein